MRPWKLIRIVALTAVVLVIVGYTAFEARGLIAGPTINVDTNLDSTPNDRIVVIHGTAERISRITLNGQDISISELGVFDEPLTLLPGYNKITLEGWGRFGEHTATTLEKYFIPAWYDEPIE